MSTAPRHVAIIGGGIFGTSAAVHLARRGVRVTLVTEGGLSSGASGRSLAWLNSAGDRSLAYHQLRIAGIDRWRTWAARTGGTDGFVRFTGGLTWAGEGESYRERYLHERALGYQSQWLSADEVAEVTAGIDPAAVATEGAIFNAGEAWVDLPSVIAVLVAEIQTRGGSVLEHAGRSRTIVEDGVAVGIVTGTGARIDSDAVVMATGPDTAAQLADLGVPIADDSPAAFVAFTKPVDVALEAVLNTPRVAVRRTIEGGLALDSGWTEERIVVSDDGQLHVGEDLVEGLFEEASRILAEHPVLELDRVGAGYKPIPGGGEPVVGAVDAVPGLFAAFSHSGATLGQIVGELLAEEIVERRASPLLETFRPARFARSA